MTEARFSGGLRAGKTQLLWEVLGHEADASTCRVCGKKFGEWREKITKQHGAYQEDCCKGFVLSKPQERKETV